MYYVIEFVRFQRVTTTIEFWTDSPDNDVLQAEEIVSGPYTNYTDALSYAEKNCSWVSSN